MAGDKKSILIADDEPAIVEALKEVLAWEGFEIFTAMDGERALSTLHDGLRPDLVLTDYMMPRLNGLQLIGEMRKAGMDQIPVIVISAAPVPSLFQQPQVRAFFQKPFELDELVVKVRQILGATASGGGG